MLPFGSTLIGFNFMRIIKFPRLKKQKPEIVTYVEALCERLSFMDKSILSLCEASLEMYNKTLKAVDHIYKEQSRADNRSIQIYYCQHDKCPGYIFKASEITHPSNTCGLMDSLNDRCDPL